MQPSKSRSGKQSKTGSTLSRLSAVLGVSGKSPGLCGRRNREAGSPEVHPVLTAAGFRGGVRVGGQRARPGCASAPGPRQAQEEAELLTSVYTEPTARTITQQSQALGRQIARSVPRPLWRPAGVLLV